ncbi:RNA polymerase sigma factor [Leptolyngbya sp. FACHB-261]|uniref:RNA polymerase sigma factor n=1 Tax=Leptolyngbya sp. FACHB-261 TaxID=2692806 RepID=UPI001683F150|nr:sigma-70 family RNA polymerase sigma factor [Leptolyngbya sp. FACHB-261]MBD2102676.1 sigma-70 family RNA polymerase sigma factor [Leptolyngbya sp. FACHB-261]
MKPDEVLVQDAQRDPAAFAELYRRYLNPIYRYQMARVGNTHDAQDLTAQTFLAAQESLNRYQNQGKFAAWLTSIARRKLADHFRRKRPTLPLEMAEDIAHSTPSAEDVLDRQLFLQQIAQALNRLTPDRAEAIALRMFGGFSVAEAAQMMGKSEAAFRMLVSRALDDLRTYLSPTVGERS